MDDELEDKVLYQTFVSHMKILSKFAVGISSINSPLAYIWKICRLYILRPEVLFCGLILFIFLIYLQAVDVWSRGLFTRIQASLGRQKANSLKMLDGAGGGDFQSWEDKQTQSSAYSIVGRRPHMEDRFVIEENVNNNTGVSVFAVFDGHGGEFAADYAKNILVQNIFNKIIETVKVLNNPSQYLHSGEVDYSSSPYLKRKASRKLDESNKENEPALHRRESLRKAQSTADDCVAPKNQLNQNQKDEDIFTSKLNSLMRNSFGKDTFLNNNNINKDNGGSDRSAPAAVNARCYIENGKINFGKLLTDEVLAADFKMVETARKNTNIAGTTALIAVIHGNRLTVANVGDSRGVMCDGRGIAIPLSFDHKPQQVRERKRIHDAGGFIAFRGVWRVAGILATSRAMGDYPLKDKNLVIANPDILTFDLNDHKPSFIILASDGLWDTFSNEEACAFAKEHITEPDFGAKALAMQSYNRGSVDNISVIVVVFRNGSYRIASATATSSSSDNSNETTNNESLQSNNIRNVPRTAGKGLTSFSNERVIKK